MNIKKIIKEEVDNLEWMKSIPTPKPISKRKKYQIQLCGENKQRIPQVRQKLIDLYGEESLEYVADEMSELMADGMDGMILYVEGYLAVTEYNTCESLNNYPEYDVVDIDTLMDYVIEEDM